MKKLIFLSAVTALFLAPALQASCGSFGSSHKKKSRSEEPSLVGTYTVAIPFPGTTVYGNISFHEGGTLHGADSADIGQLVPGLSPNASVSTVWTGNWEKIGQRAYRIFYTSVIAEKNPDDCCPSFPFARLKIEGTVTLSCDGQQLSSNLLASFWDLSDLTVNTVNIVPPTPTPLTGQRVPTFSNCGCRK